MTPMNIAMTTLLNGICLGAILASVIILLLKFFSRLNSTTRFTVLWMALLAVVALLATPLVPRTPVAEPRIESPAAVVPGPAAMLEPLQTQVDWLERKPHASHVESVQSQNRVPASRQRLEPPVSQNAFTNSLPATTTEQSLIRIHSAKFARAMAIAWSLFSLLLL